MTVPPSTESCSTGATPALEVIRLQKVAFTHVLQTFPSSQPQHPRKPGCKEKACPADKGNAQASRHLPSAPDTVQLFSGFSLMSHKCTHPDTDTWPLLSGLGPCVHWHGPSEDHKHGDQHLPVLDTSPHNTTWPLGELTKQVKHPERGLFPCQLPSLKRISTHEYPRCPKVKLFLSARDSPHLLPVLPQIHSHAGSRRGIKQGPPLSISVTGPSAHTSLCFP